MWHLIVSVPEHCLSFYLGIEKKIYICVCVFQVFRPYLGFLPDPKHFIVLKIYIK